MALKRRHCNGEQIRYPSHTHTNLITAKKVRARVQVRIRATKAADEAIGAVRARRTSFFQPRARTRRRITE